MSPKVVENHVTGLCRKMCPKSEVRFRCSNGMVHVLERSNPSAGGASNRELVKEYARPAAGRDHLHPECLRPPDVLLQTVLYLLALYEEEKCFRFDCAYSFVCDRLRAVRQDMILQDVSPVDTVRILEAMIPFYIETDYLCKTQGCGTYDWKLHSNFLEECFSRWSEATSSVPKSLVSGRIVCAYILHQVQSHSIKLNIYRWRDFLSQEIFTILRDLVISYHCNNYIRFFRKLLLLPADYFAVAAVDAIKTLRLKALSTIDKAYRSANAKIPLSSLANWLHYCDICDLADLFSKDCDAHTDSVQVSSINLSSVHNENFSRLIAKL